MNRTKNEKEARAVLVSLVTPGGDEAEAEKSLDELERLLETSGGFAVAKVTQAREKPDAGTYIGSGKCEEIAALIKNSPEEEKITLAVFDDELTPSQIANLEDALGCRVIDRTMLILDIFASRAVTAEGKLQVEIAILRYSVPRLIGKGTQLSRLGGGIGTRGPGESKLETDRRHVKNRIKALSDKLSALEKQRSTIRAGRRKSNFVTAAIVGYTNAGKSTLLNRLTDAGILAEDKLFATLDPTTRKLHLTSGRDILLTDTVGFINRLPHKLIEAFRSTLDEVRYADMIIDLRDASDSEETQKMKATVTQELLSQLGAGAKPVITVYNKSDACETQINAPGAQVISAKSGAGIPELLKRLDVEANALKTGEKDD
ncbi:MAG TPA: GTPase HflX [Bacillota bacterium]|nr:GTPase HflX [Bacillota bacterium]